MSVANRVVRNTGFLYAKMGVTMVMSLYTTRLVLSGLGSSDFGLFNIVGGAIAMLSFLNGAMSVASQRFMSIAEGEGNIEKQKKIFNISIVLHTVIGFCVVLLLLIAAFFFFDGILKINQERVNAARVVYGCLIVSTFFTIITVPYDAILNARENMLYYSLIGVLESILKLVVAIIVFYSNGDRLVLYGILMALIPVFSMIVMRIYCHINYEECTIKPIIYWDKSIFIQMANFAGWSFLGSMSSVLSASGIGLIMNIFHGTVANASQGIANQVSGQLGSLGSNIKKALNPIIVKSVGANNHELMVKSTILGTKIILFVVTTMFLIFMIEMPFILKVWLDNPPKDAQIFCWLLLLTNFINDLILFLPQAIGAVGKIKRFQISNSIMLFLPLFVTYIAYTLGAPPYFIYFSTSIIGVLQNFIVMYYAEIICNIPFKTYFVNVILRCTCSFLLSLVLGYLLTYLIHESLLRFFITFIFTVISYTAIYFYIGLNDEEKKYVLDFGEEYLRKSKIKYRELFR